MNASIERCAQRARTIASKLFLSIFGPLTRNEAIGLGAVVLVCIGIGIGATLARHYG